MATLFAPLSTGALQFKNRIFMAPMTRSRAPDRIPTDLMAEYYAQRASAGLIFTEATQVSPQGIGYISTPGLHTSEQVEGWKKVTRAVHAHGGLIFPQLWHVGRVSHPDFHQGQAPVAPSAISFEGQAYTPEGFKKVETPRALLENEIHAIIKDFGTSAELAKKAGFDGVEIHSANGYLLHQFLEDGSNKRADNWGGSIENRTRFVLAILDEVLKVWEPSRVSVRISPQNPFHGMHDSSPLELYTYLVKEFNARKLGILHVLEGPNLRAEGKALLPKLREIFDGIVVANAGYDDESGNEEIKKGNADAIAYGALFISNPDLPERFVARAQLNKAHPETFYGGDQKGYTDYPKLA